MLRLILSAAVVAHLVGCSIGGSTLQEWSESKDGESRLCAFLADPTRDQKLRLDALDFLIQGGNYSSIIGVFSSMDKLEQKKWVKYTWYKIGHRLTKQKFSTVDRIEAASLAYYLLQYPEHLDGYANEGQSYQKPFAEFAAVDLVTWSLETIKMEEDVPKGTKKLSEVMFAAAVAHPVGVLPQFDGFLSTMPEDDDYLLVTDILARLKTQESHQLEAKALLALAKKNYPKIAPEVGERMFKNRNETLLRFLLDAAIDVRVHPKVRLYGLQASEVLKEKATDGLLSLLRTEEPKKDNIMRTQALEKLWLYAGGQKILATALSSLPTEGTYWPEGTKFKVQVQSFCDNTLRESAGDVKETLIELTSSDNFVAQIYAGECILRLYPDEAEDLLQDLIEEDLDEEVLGWDESGAISFSEYLEEASSR